MRSAVLAVVVGLISLGIANATIPEPGLCTVLPCDTFGGGATPGMVTCPNNGTNPVAAANFTVHAVNGQGNVIPGAFVEIIFGTPGNHHFCPNATLTGTTDALGDKTFNLSMGGCTIGAGAVQIKVNNTPIRTWTTVKAADWNGAASDGAVALADFVYFAGRYNAGSPGCTDYFNSSVTDLPDFVFFAACYAHACQ
jgi:hypothetical protein